MVYHLTELFAACVHTQACKFKPTLYKSVFPRSVNTDAVSQVKAKMEDESVKKEDNGLSMKLTECETQRGQMC